MTVRACAVSVELVTLAVDLLKTELSVPVWNTNHGCVSIGGKPIPKLKPVGSNVAC